MIYQLPNGKTIEISMEMYLDMSDDELNYLIAYNLGEEMNDPFYASALNGRDIRSFDEIDDDIELELPDIPISERIFDKNFKSEDVEE